jgi:hypothetical protein
MDTLSMNILTTRTLKYPESRALDLLAAIPVSALAAGLSYTLTVLIHERAIARPTETLLITLLASLYFTPFAAVAACVYYALGRFIGELGLWQCLAIGVLTSALSVASIDLLKYVNAPMLTLGICGACSAGASYCVLYALAGRRRRRVR